jgi:hypothetical protein
MDGTSQTNGGSKARKKAGADETSRALAPLLALALLTAVAILAAGVAFLARVTAGGAP